MARKFPPCGRVWSRVGSELARPFLRPRGERPECQTAACPGGEGVGSRGWRGGGAGRCPGGGYLEGTLGTPPAAESLLEVKTKEDARQ